MKLILNSWNFNTTKQTNILCSTSEPLGTKQLSHLFRLGTLGLTSQARARPIFKAQGETVLESSGIHEHSDATIAKHCAWRLWCWVVWAGSATIFYKDMFWHLKTYVDLPNISWKTLVTWARNMLSLWLSLASVAASHTFVCSTYTLMQSTRYLCSTSKPLGTKQNAYCNKAFFSEGLIRFNCWPDNSKEENPTGMPWGDTNTLPNPAADSPPEVGSKLASVNTTQVSDMAGDTNLGFWASKKVLKRTRDDISESPASLLPERYAWLVTFARQVFATLPDNCPAVNCIRPLTLRASAELNFLVSTICPIKSPSSRFLASVLSVETLP